MDEAEKYKQRIEAIAVSPHTHTHIFICIHRKKEGEETVLLELSLTLKYFNECAAC